MWSNRPSFSSNLRDSHHLVLDVGERKVETTLYLDGNTLRMNSHETYPSSEAASKAFERLKRLLAGEGYQAG